MCVVFRPRAPCNTAWGDYCRATYLRHRPDERSRFFRYIRTSANAAFARWPINSPPSTTFAVVVLTIDIPRYDPSTKFTGRSKSAAWKHFDNRKTAGSIYLNSVGGA